MFLAYRLVLATCCVLFLVESIYRSPNYTWLLHFSHQSIIVTALYFLTGSVICIYRGITEHVQANKQKQCSNQPAASGSEDDLFLPPSDEESPHTDDFEHLANAFEPPDLERDGLSWMYKFYWLCYTVSANSIIVGTLNYILLHEKLDTLEVSSFLSMTAFMLTDTLISFIPVKLLHVIYSFAFTALYVVAVTIFLVACNFKTEEAIYILSGTFRSSTQTAIASVVILLGQPIFQLIYFGLHKLRWLFVGKFYSRDEEL